MWAGWTEGVQVTALTQTRNPQPSTLNPFRSRVGCWVDQPREQGSTHRLWGGDARARPRDQRGADPHPRQAPPIRCVLVFISHKVFIKSF